MSFLEVFDVPASDKYSLSTHRVPRCVQGEGDSAVGKGDGVPALLARPASALLSDFFLFRPTHQLCDVRTREGYEDTPTIRLDSVAALRSV